MTTKQRYLTAFDEINRLVPTSYLAAVERHADETDVGERKKKIADDVIDDVLSLLIGAYKAGVDDISDTFGVDIEADLDDMYEALYFVWGDGMNFENRIRKHVDEDNPDGVILVAETEAHRDFATGQSDSVNQGQQQNKIPRDLTIVKEWNTMQDERVRDSHEYLQGMRVGLRDEFYTYDGDHAPFPGLFEKVEENANCRCWVEYVAL